MLSVESNHSFNLSGTSEAPLLLINLSNKQAKRHARIKIPTHSTMQNTEL